MGGGRGRERGEAGQAEGERMEKENQSIAPFKKLKIKIPDPFNLSNQTFLLLLPYVYWKGCDWGAVPFARFTELLEGVTAAETCSGERKKNALRTERKRESLKCLASFTNNLN